MANTSIDSIEALALVDDLVDQSISKNTAKSYQYCWQQFVSYCRPKDQDPLQCDQSFVLKFLARRQRHVGASRLYVYLSAISHFYRREGLSSPCDNPKVKMFMKGKNVV